MAWPRRLEFDFFGRIEISERFWCAQFGLLLCLLLPANVLGQCPTAPQGVIVANPNRPTVADPADITELGVLELEYGWERDWRGGGQRGNAFGGLLKFAVLCDLEIRWSMDDLVGERGRRGIGDNRIGAQYRLHRQTGRLPTLAVSYALKVPTASEEKGLGSGQNDHQLKFLASKDLRGTHFDFNAAALWIGRPLSLGYDRNAEGNLAFSHPVRGDLGLTGEIYGDTRLNNATPGFISTLWALTYKFSPRLVVDAGLDVALTAEAPHRKRFVFGFVYSLGELYRHLRGSARKD